MSFADLVNVLVKLVDTAVMPLMYSIAFIGFLIGMVRYFFMGGEEARQKGRQFMIWSIVGFAVMFSVWGIVHLLLSALPGYAG